MAENNVNTTNEEDKKKKKKIFIIFGSILGAGAIAGASVGIYFAVKPKAQEVKVDVPEINGLVFSNQKAYVGQDYNTEISVNKTLTTSLLPDELKSVKSGNRTIADTEYTYNLADNKETAQFHIPGKYIEGDVTIDLELVSKVPNYFYFKNVGEENAKFLTILLTNETDPSKFFPDLHCSNDPNKDLSQWEKLSFGSKFEEGIYINTRELEPGDSLYFYGDNPNGINGLVDDTEFYFASSLDGKPTNEKLAVGGNISSLVYRKEFENKNEVPNEYCYRDFFIENDKIITAKDLILPTAGCKKRCFNNMFYSCTNLEYAPYLGANTEQVSSTSCYAGMFSGCKKLKELKVNFGVNNIWPQGVHTNGSATDNWLTKDAGATATNPTFYWRGDDDPNRTIVQKRGDYVPEGWKVLHWE